MSNLKSKSKILKIISFAFCVLALSFAFCVLRLKTVAAQEEFGTRSFSISPPTLKFSLKPGEKTEKSIKITNKSNEPITFTVDVHDFIVTDKNGTPEIIPSGLQIDNRYAASTWMTALPDNLTIQPGKSGTTTLYLQVPSSARPGGRYVAVAFRPETLSGNQNDTGASVNTIVGSLVYLTVQGQIEENARIISFNIPLFSEYGPIKILTEIKNLGDLHISPRAKIEIKNLFGKTNYSASIGDFNIFPGTSRIYTNSWEKKWLFGRYTASLSGYYGQANNLPLYAVVSFWVIPYKIILIILLAIVIAAVAYLYSRKKNNEEQDEEEGSI